MLPQLLNIVLFLNVLIVITGFHFISKNLIHRYMKTNKSSFLILHAKQKHKVTINHEGVNNILEINENESILEAALDAGISLPHDCKMGVCLRCSAKVTSGIVDQTGTTLDDSVMKQGFALTCMTFPRSELVIKSVDEDELVNAQFSGRY